MGKKQLKTALLVLTTIFFSIILTATTGFAIIQTTIEMGYHFTDDGGDPEGGTPWLVADFYDADTPDSSILLVMSTPGLVEEEFVSNWFFNVKPDELFALTFTPQTLSPALFPEFAGYSEISTYPSIDQNLGTAVNHGFNVDFDFPNSGNRFVTGMYSAYLISTDSNDGGTPPVDLSIVAANFIIEGIDWANGEDMFTVAHVQGIDTIGYDDNELSAWITEGGGGGGGGGGEVPEPSTIFLLGGGLLMMAAGWRRKKKK